MEGKHGTEQEGRAKRLRTKMDPSGNKWTVMVTKLFCKGATGERVPLHECDIAFMSYENLRKELGYAEKCAAASACFLSLASCSMSH